MTKSGRRKSARSTHGRLPSPGRPPVGRREDRMAFWAAIARGLYPIAAVAHARVSWVGGRGGFAKLGACHQRTCRHPLGCPPGVTSRSRSVNSWRCSAHRTTACASVRDTSGARPRRCHESYVAMRRREAGRSTTPRARRSGTRTVPRSAPRSRGGASSASSVCTGSRLRGDRDTKWHAHVRAHGRLEGTSARSASASALGACVESGTDRPSACGRHPHAPTIRISPEAIYQALYIQSRGELRQELTACLRTGRALRVPAARTRATGKRFVTPELMISERPAEIADRAVPGHWEGDLILGLDSSAIGTLVERTTRCTMLLRLPRMAARAEGARTTAIKNGPPLAGHGETAVRSPFRASCGRCRRSCAAR